MSLVEKEKFDFLAFNPSSRELEFSTRKFQDYLNNFLSSFKDLMIPASGVEASSMKDKLKIRIIFIVWKLWKIDFNAGLVVLEKETYSYLLEIRKEFLSDWEGVNSSFSELFSRLEDRLEDIILEFRQNGISPRKVKEKLIGLRLKVSRVHIPIEDVVLNEKENK